MTLDAPRWERIRTEAGWHLRLKAKNGEIVLTSEVYEDPRRVEAALAVVAEADLPLTFTVDER